MLKQIVQYISNLIVIVKKNFLGKSSIPFLYRQFVNVYIEQTPYLLHIYIRLHFTYHPPTHLNL